MLSDKTNAAVSAFPEDSLSAGAEETRLAIERIAAEMTVLLQGQELSRTTLDELRSQLTVIRQIVDYVLFVTPDQTDQDGDLYPFSHWLTTQFNTLLAELRESRSSAEASKHNEILALQRAIQDEISDLRGLLNRSREASEAELMEKLRPVGELQQQMLARLSELTDAALHKSRDSLRRAGTMEPDDDLDLQLSEIKQLLLERTRRWRIYENFFYGLVIALLVLNILIQVWLISYR